MDYIRKIQERFRRIQEWIDSTFRPGGFWFNTFFVLLVVMVVVVGVCLTLANWDWLQGGIETPEPSSIPDSGSTPESNSTTLRNVGLLVGGAIALVFALWRGIVASHQADTARRQMEVTQGQVRIAQQSLLTERYQRGVDMLGSDVFSVRQDGINSLRSLANEYPEQYHIQVMLLLCAFVRSPTQDDVVETNTDDSDEDPNPREDVQVALEAICDCHETNAVRGNAPQSLLDFRGADLQGAQLRGVDLSVRRSLRGRTSTEGRNSYTRGADFTQAQLNSARMSRAKFPRANFTEANLSSAYISDTDLSRARLWYADLSGAILRDANLSGASLLDADLSGARLLDANLSGARLLDANLSGARLRGANLSGATLQDANLSGARLRGANLSNADMSGANLSGVRDLTQAQLGEACADPDRLPELDKAYDAETGEILEWNGKTLDDVRARPRSRRNPRRRSPRPN